MKVLLLAYFVMSAVTFVVYGWDKFKAKKGMWRTPEKTLHILELCCGWPGALLAHKLLRHKSHKKSFRTAFWCMVAVNVLAVAYWLSGRIV